MKFEFMGELKAGNERTNLSSNWKSGRHINSQGYVLLYCPEHPQADYGGYIREHRLIMERHLGRFLEKEERIHHKDENKTNNSIDNLQLFSSESLHQHTIPHGNSKFVYIGRVNEYTREYYFKNRDKILNRNKIRARMARFRKQNEKIL